jgi:hypothetical protein
MGSEWAPWVSGLFVIVTLLGTHWFTQSREREKIHREQYLQVYRELMGSKVVLEQLSYSHLEMAIYVRYFIALAQISHASGDRHWEEHRRWTNEDIQVVTRLTGALQRLFELLATATVLFPRDAQLKGLIDSFDADPKLEVLEGPGSDFREVDLHDWMRRALAKAKDDSSSAYTPQLNAVLARLRELDPGVGST